MSWLQRLRINKFLLLLILVVIIASLFPCERAGTSSFQIRLPPQLHVILYAQCQVKLSCTELLPCTVLIAVMSYWRLDLIVFFSTFSLFPLQS